MTTSPWTFNLWTEPWIRVTRRDGANAELSIGDCLAEAHTLAALHDPSPLVVAGVHRLLTAILQAIYAPRDLGDIQVVLAGAQFDAERLEGFAARYAERFDLFHPTAPFLQTSDVPLDGWKQLGKGDTKSVAYLFHELPTGINRTLFHHIIDEGHKVCPACCVRGLITMPAFAMSGGSGIRPSINADPPIYVLPVGNSLFESLASSLLAPDFLPKAADPGRATASAWNSGAMVNKGHEVAAVGYLESLTFPARRVRLFPESGLNQCTQCGTAVAVVVSRLVFDMGHYRSKTAVVWDDPFVAFRAPRGKSKQDESGPKPVRPEAGKSLWREYSTLLLSQQEKQMRPKVVQQIGVLIENRKALAELQSVRFRCISIRNPNGKATIFEWLDEALEAPPALLADDDASLFVDEAIERAGHIEGTLSNVFNRYFHAKRTDEKRSRFMTLRTHMLARYWQTLAPHFRRLVFLLNDPAARDEAIQNWTKTILQMGEQVFDQTADLVGERGTWLRHYAEARSALWLQFARYRKEWGLAKLDIDQE